MKDEELINAKLDHIVAALSYIPALIAAESRGDRGVWMRKCKQFNKVIDQYINLSNKENKNENNSSNANLKRRISR